MARDFQPPTKIVIKRDNDRIDETLERVENGIEHAFHIKTGPATPFSLRLGVKTDGISKATQHESNLCFWGNDNPVFANPLKKVLETRLFFDRI